MAGSAALMSSFLANRDPLQSDIKISLPDRFHEWSILAFLPKRGAMIYEPRWTPSQEHLCISNWAYFPQSHSHHCIILRYLLEAIHIQRAQPYRINYGYPQRLGRVSSILLALLRCCPPGSTSAKAASSETLEPLSTPPSRCSWFCSSNAARVCVSVLRWTSVVCPQSQTRQCSPGCWVATYEN